MQTETQQEEKSLLKRYPNLDKVLTIAFGFIMLFTAYISCLSQKVLQDLGYQNLGFLNLAIVYLSFSITSVFAASINRRFGTKRTLFFSGLTYAVWIGGFLMPAYQSESLEVEYPRELIIGVNIGTAVILGMGAGPLWVSMSYYVNQCANESNKGRYNSLFNFFYFTNYQASSVTLQQVYS